MSQEEDCLFYNESPKWPFTIENITVVQAPLLKIYYWESLDINGLNIKLDSPNKCMEHDLYIPTAQINSCQLRVVFWIRDRSEKGTEYHLKRIQNCECVTYPTRVGFNQYKNLYHCPHRHLVNINQEEIRTNPDELVAMTFVIYFYFLGQHKLTYELRCGEDNILRFHFHVSIVCFEADKCLLTKELIPVEMTEARRFVQALWVRNITMQDLKFTFNTKSRGLKIINNNLTVPRQSVWPLMVDFRPTDFVDELQIMQTFDNVKTIHNISASGYIGCVRFTCSMPVTDYDCYLHRFITHPNKLDFDVGPDEERSLMVNIHNYDQKCVEFHWQNYVINHLFKITYEPEVFRLKGHHSKLCVVHLRSFDRPLHFVRLPLVLEVHRIFDRGTRIAKDLLSEIESIDDPKWKQDSYMEHVLLQVDLKINFKKLATVNLKYEPVASDTYSMLEIPAIRNQPTTIFEKLFWEYLSQSDFMRPNKNPEKNSRLSYTELFDLYSNPPCITPPSELSRNNVLRLMSKLIAEGIRDVSKNWIFVPPDAFERPL